MIFTVFYVYATLMQWFRLRNLKDKLAGTLTNHNALLICSGDTIRNNRRHRSLENLLFRTENRIACTVVPKQKLQLSQWIAFPKNLNYFPIDIAKKETFIDGQGIYILLQAHLDSYTKHDSAVIRVEHYGELIGWKAIDCFEILLKSNMANLTKLINQFAQNDVDINHDLKLLKVETVDVEGATTTIKYDKLYPIKFSYAPSHWSKFVGEFKELYSRIHNVTNPKIKIENGTKSFEAEANKHEAAEVHAKKHEEKDKNTLEVTSVSRHKQKTKTTTKDEKKMKTNKKRANDTKAKGHDDKPKKETAGPSTSVKTRQRAAIPKLVKQSSVKENGGVARSSEAVNPEIIVSIDDAKQEMTENPEAEVPKGAKTVIVDNEGVIPKPPNVLVYADSVITKENVKKVLFSILNKDKYTIYDLPTASIHFWDKTTTLVVVCGGVQPHLTPHLIHYLLNGGKLLCLCSDLMNSVLQTFTTAEVREHELVRFTYGSWKNVKMMHHIFCYQASPAKKQFSKDSDHSNHSGGESTSPNKLKSRAHPSKVTLHHNDRDHDIQVKVLGAEETWNTPSLLLAVVKNTTNGGRAIFSQVHLEIDPEEYENDDEKYEHLKSSNAARLEILKDILEKHLGMECGHQQGVDYKPGYFLGRFDVKVDMISHTSCIKDNRLDCPNLSVVFCGHTAEPGEASDSRFPVLIHSCPANFSTLDYFETLNTEQIGRLVIYADILTSTHHVLAHKLRHGLAVIAARQTSAVGRAKNTWLSPLGSACFSLQLHIPLDSNLGRHLPIIQHMVVVAVVTALKKDRETLTVGIKWPNDLYANGNVKIGGVIANSTIEADCAMVNIGCGVNLSNDDPTVSVNGLLKEKGEKTITHERFYAIVFNELENLYGAVQERGFEEFYQLYYQHWLHGDAQITLQTSEKGDVRQAKVIGIDEFGFLQVKLLDGDKSITSLHPDGNSFDMMRGLIAPKMF